MAQIYPEDRGTNYAIREGRAAAQACWRGWVGNADHGSPSRTHAQPEQPAPWMLLLLVLALLLPLVLGGMDALYAHSTDLGHHYALTARLYQDWSLPPGIDHSLGEMNLYPRASHQLAALLGKLLGSPLAGMQLLGGLSIAIIWAALSAVLLALPQRAAWCCALLLAALTLG
jgi:hypothetical protein